MADRFQPRQFGERQVGMLYRELSAEYCALVRPDPPRLTQQARGQVLEAGNDVGGIAHSGLRHYLKQGDEMEA